MKKSLSTALIAVSFVSSANAQTIQIRNNPGGIVGDFIDRYHHIAANGDKIELSGSCASACTLVLMLPRRAVCAMPGTMLGFHGASHSDGGPVDVAATRQLFKTYYPRWLQRWYFSKPISAKLRWRSARSLGIAPCLKGGNV